LRLGKGEGEGEGEGLWKETELAGWIGLVGD
jgi:hypothetical protein